MKKKYFILGFMSLLLLFICNFNIISAKYKSYGLSLDVLTKNETIVTNEDLHKYDSKTNLIAIFDFDDRNIITDTTLSPYRAVCFVETTFGNTTYRGSGILVAGNVLLTASHLIYSNDDGGWATSVSVYPGYDNGYAPYGNASWTKATIGNFFNTNDSNDDWAVVTLNKDFSSTTGYYGLSAELSVNSPVTLLSYPGDMNSYMVSSSDKVTELFTYKFNHKCDLVGGSSGGALIDSNFKVVGVQSTETKTSFLWWSWYSYNTACRVSNYIIGYVNDAKN